MKTRHIIKTILVTAFLIPFSLQAVTYSGGLLAGYNSGPGLYFNAEFSDFEYKSPLKLRLGAGYTRINNPGNSMDARKIFINNATNGRPEKQGWFYDFRLDLLYRVSWFNLPDAYMYGGLRFAKFTGNFNYVDGNENFDIVSEHWGWGLGMANYIQVNKKLDIIIDTGLDYFIPATLTGHDTSYSPDNENVNAREDFKFGDADAAINQPKFNLRLMVGINYHLK